MAIKVWKRRRWSLAECFPFIIALLQVTATRHRNLYLLDARGKRHYFYLVTNRFGKFLRVYLDLK